MDCRFPGDSQEIPFAKLGNSTFGIKTDPGNQHLKFIYLLEGFTECDSYSLHLSRVLTIFTINCSTIIFGTQQLQTRGTLPGFWLYKGTDLLLPHSWNSFPSLQLEKLERQHRDKSPFSRGIYLLQSTGHSWFSITSEWRHCRLLEVTAELLASKVSNTLERPLSSRGLEHRKFKPLKFPRGLHWAWFSSKRQCQKAVERSSVTLQLYFFFIFFFFPHQSCFVSKLQFSGNYGSVPVMLPCTYCGKSPWSHE